MPLVLFPAADELIEAILATATPQAVEEHVAYVYLLRILEITLTPGDALNPKANIPCVLLPAAEPCLLGTLAVPTPQAVEVSLAYVYLFRIPPLFSENIPLVLFPAAEPSYGLALDDATPEAVEVHVAYVYLLRTLVIPNAKIPTVLLPAAEPVQLSPLDAATPQAVEEHVA